MTVQQSFIKNVVQIMICIGFSFLIGAVFLLAQGENPLEIYYYLTVDPFLSLDGIVKLLGKATPLIFTGLAVAVSFKCGIFNIGVEGQLLFGALAAALVGYYCAGLPYVIHVVLTVFAGMAAGMVYAFVPAILKIKLKIHEVITTIMMNSIASALTAFIIVNFVRNPGQTARTYTVADTARFAQFTPPEHLNTGLIIALICVAVLCVLVYRTPYGMQLNAVGTNPVAARYSGIDSNKIIIVTMLLSGAIAGLCGTERVLGAFGYMQVNFSSGYGFDGITVAVIGKNNPLGACVAAIFIGALQCGGTTISMMTQVPAEFIQALIAIIFIMVAAQNAIFGGLGKLFGSERREVKTA